MKIQQEFLDKLIGKGKDDKIFKELRKDTKHLLDIYTQELLSKYRWEEKKLNKLKSKQLGAIILNNKYIGVSVVDEDFFKKENLKKVVKNNMDYNKLTQNQKVELEEFLWEYSNWLHKHNYLDTDYYTEKPNAVDEFIKTLVNK